MMIMGNKKTEANWDRITLTERELGPECFKNSVTDEGVHEVYLQIQCTGLSERLFGPFSSVDEARLWWDNMLDKVLDLFDEDDKRAFLSSEPLVQKWLDRSECIGLAEDDTEAATEEESEDIRVCIRLTHDEVEQLKQIAREKGGEGHGENASL
jgi:hypothetical protein